MVLATIKPPNRDFLLSALSSINSAHEALSLYADSAGNHGSDARGVYFENALRKLVALSKSLYGLPELDDVRSFLLGPIKGVK